MRLHASYHSHAALFLAILLLQIDGMKNRVLMKRFGVTGFPSLYLMRNGQTWQYMGMRGVADVSGAALL
jgi:protein-disulfide isomerase-like protein with CxxC motif